MSIFSKLFKLFLTVVLMPLVPMALLLVYYQEHLRDNVLETHSNLAQMAAASMNQHIEALSWRLAFTQNINQDLTKKKNPVPVLKDALSANPDFIFLAVLNPKGREIYRAARAGFSETAPLDLAQDPGLTDLARRPALTVSGLDIEDGQPVSEFLYPLSNGYALYGVMNFNSFLARLQEQRIGNTGRIYMAESKGRFFTGALPYEPLISPAALQATFTAAGGVIKKIPSQTGPYVGAYAKLPVLGTYVAVLQKKDEAFRSIDYSNIIILLFFLGIATLAYFGALSFAESLSRPIEALANGATAVSAGDLDQKIDEEVDWTEFQNLIIAFNKMTADLKDYQLLQLKAQISQMKEDVFRSVAHDLRAPLLGLQGYLYILESAKATEEEKKEYLSLMSQAAKNLSLLLEDVLDVSRVQAGMILPTKQPVDVDKLSKETLDAVRPQAQEKGLTLTTQTSGIMALADPKLLRRILLNLVSNAIKFTSHGFVHINAYNQNGQCVISVQDSGIGIDLKDQETLFQKYHQLGQGAGGYGLGLFISRQMAHAHGGTLTLQSNAGQGSTFTLTLPGEDA